MAKRDVSPTTKAAEQTSSPEIKNRHQALREEIRLSTKKNLGELKKEVRRNTNKILDALEQGLKKLAALDQKTTVIDGKHYTHKEIIEKLKNQVFPT